MQIPSPFRFALPFLLASALSAVTVPDLPEPLKSNYQTSVEESLPAMVAEVEAYPVPPGETVSTRFTVDVDGVAVPVLEESRTYAHFSFNGTVTVTVTATTPGALTGWKVSPVDYGIAETNDGTTLSFQLNRPRYLAIHQNYESDLVPLFIFADPIEHNPPKPTDINVLDYGSYSGTINEAVTAVSLDPTLDIVYVPPGTYDSGQIDMKSDTQLYLAGGALIRFTGSDYGTPLEYDWIRKGDAWGGLEFLGVDNAKVFGRGTLDALNNGSFNNCVYSNQATNITISGIITRYSNDWNWLLTESDGVDITYVKVINDH